VRFQPTGPLCHQLVAGLHRSREGHGTERGGAPPDGILGPPSPWCPNSLSSLDPAWTPRRSGSTHLAVSPRLGKHHPREISPKSGPVPLDGRGAWSTPRKLQEEFHRSSVRFCPTGQKGSLIHSRQPPRGVPQVRDFSQRGKETVKTSVWMCACVCVCVWICLKHGQNLICSWNSSSFYVLLSWHFFLACLIYKTFFCVCVCM
jgi:hypothetical protein